MKRKGTKRKGYKTSPSVRVPRAAVERLAQVHAARFAQYTREMESLRGALRKLLARYDELAGGAPRRDGWTHADIAEIQRIRELAK